MARWPRRSSAPRRPGRRRCRAACRRSRSCRSRGIGTTPSLPARRRAIAGSVARSSRVGAERALPGREVVAEAGPRQLQPRDRLVVAGDERQAARVRRRDSDSSSSGTPGRTCVGQVAVGTGSAYTRQHAARTASARSSIRARRDAGAEQHRPRRSPRLSGRPARRPGRAAVRVDAVHLPQRRVQRVAVCVGRAAQRACRRYRTAAAAARSRPQRSNDMPGSSRRANAAISRAAASMSSSATISTGECM